MSDSKHEFSSDINNLLYLIIHAFYSKKDVFIREIISNASDALDKIRHQSLSDKSVLDTESDLRIRIIPDPEAKTLTIEDTGIGMTKDDLIKNLSTIAKSGTKEWMSMVADGKADVSLIGQFGVGFYSIFLVANQVTVYTKHNSSSPLVWKSDGKTGYTIEDAPEFDLGRGTRIILHLADDQQEYLEDETIKSLVKEHSQFVSWPIYLYATKTVEEEQEEASEEEKEEEKNEDDIVVEDKEEESSKEKKTVTKTVHEFEHLNSQPAIWTRNPKDISDEEYIAFYKNTTGDYQEPLAWKHVVSEGSHNFRALIFIPKFNASDMFNSSKTMDNMKLYVRRVFITDDSKQFIPEWLSFIKGLVDSEDLPLNVSREMLQKNKAIQVIQKTIVKKCIELFNEIIDSEDSEKRDTFNKNFAKFIKFGIAQSADNKEKLAECLSFKSTKSGDESTTLQEYIDRMSEKQSGIFYICGETKEAIEKSPFVTAITKRGYEVLLLSETIDEYCFNSLSEFKGKKLVCITKETVELDSTEEEAELFKQKEEELKDFCEAVKNIVGGGVEKVVVSKRVTGVPCIISTSDYGYSANMQRIINAQALNDNEMMSFMNGRKIMEINPFSSLIQYLAGAIAKDAEDKLAAASITLLYQSACISSGFTPESPVDFADSIYNMVATANQTENVETREEAVAEAKEESVEEDID